MRWIIAAALAVGLLAAWNAPYPAWGHDEHQWINDGMYRSLIDGMLCCGPTDCETISAEQVQITPAGYVVQPFGDVVPTDKALPSLDGNYHRCHKPDGSLRCFFYPPQGS